MNNELLYLASTVLDPPRQFQLSMLARAFVGRLPATLTKCGKCDISGSRPLATLHQEHACQRTTTRSASSSSSTRWKTRQTNDSYAREAKVSGLKSRAAFKLLEINDKHRIFRRGDTVVDLGFAPGSWSQVAVNRTSPGGRVVGIDVIPAQPPQGANALQGNFLSPEIREEVRKFVSDPTQGRVRQRGIADGGVTEEELARSGAGILQLERQISLEENRAKIAGQELVKENMTQKELDVAEGRVVDVVLSDMMQNTSGMPFRDHAGSMDLCMAGLTFCYDTLKTGGHFLCKFFAGAEDHALEMRLKHLFEKVHRIKPDSSRKESKEAYFIALKRKAGVRREDVLDEG